MNYGEKLAYWYLRLNGFFPVTNFVTHGHIGEVHEQSGDVDLLAVRPPHVSELIGGQQGDWDRRFDGWEIDFNANLVGLIVEVKTGERIRMRLIDRMFKHRSHQSVCRLGIVPPDQIQAATNTLEQSPLWRENGAVIGKLLVSRDPCPEEAPWLNITLNECVDFISDRIDRYRSEKNRDAIRFSDPLMEFIAAGFLNRNGG